MSSCKVHLLDMTDEEYAFGANLLAVGQHLTAVAQTQFIDRFIHVFETLWPEIASQQYLLRYLRACLITVLAAPCPNLEDIYRLLTDDNFRSGLLQHVTDQTVREFWQHQYDELTPSARLQRTAPLVGRLEAIQMARPILKSIPNNPLVSDPFPVLNRLCHKAQQTGSADFFIPSTVVAGFANVGNFYGDLNWANKGKLLTSDVEYPPNLVVPIADGGTRFTRRPEHSGEWLYYCVWGLRQILTWLAEHPIGKTDAASAQAVAQALSSLQQRTAFIRSNSEVGIIYTDDLPEPLTGAALTERENFIRQQTRDKYSRPKADIEGIERETHMETSTETETNNKTARWEVL